MACRAQLNGVDAPTPEETDKHMEGIQAFAKQALAGASAAMLFTSSMEAAVAYPIFAQQNYANPREYTGKIVCANCHLASKPIEVRLPQAVLPDTIFKMEVEVPAKYAKRRQPLADGSKGPMNIGAIAVMPEGWKLAPKDRLPKPLKKEMKGLAWAPYSKERKMNLLHADSRHVYCILLSWHDKGWRRNFPSFDNAEKILNNFYCYLTQQ